MMGRLRSLLGAVAVTLIVAASTLLAPSHVPAPLQVVQQAQATLPMVSRGPLQQASAALTAEQDFANRMAADGVVFGHDFCFDAEVDQFRWGNSYGADPGDLNPARQGTTVRVADGTSCGSLESRHRVSTTTNPSDWWRPMAPLTGAGNGTGVDDPADGGTMTRYSHTPTDQGDEKDDFLPRNWYGNATYHGDEPPGTFVGTEYWFQMRMKISANRCCVGSGPAGDEGGKALYFTTITDSNVNQELVTNSFYEVTALGADDNLFQMYRSGSPGLPDDDPGPGRQVGGEYNGGVCTSTPLNASGCWFWPTDEVTEGAGNFVTLLYHVVLGTDSGNNTTVQVWKAEWGETTYTKIWDQANVDLLYEVGLPFGQNAIILSGYQNEISFTEEVWHRYDQIILSHEFIEAPQVYEGFAGRIDIFDMPALVAANEDYFYAPLWRVAGL